MLLEKQQEVEEYYSVTPVDCCQTYAGTETVQCSGMQLFGGFVSTEIFLSIRFHQPLLSNSSESVCIALEFFSL